MMVNPDVGNYAQTLSHRKILRKTQKKQQPAENQTYGKTEIEATLSGALFLRLACEGGIGPSVSPPVTSLVVNKRNNYSHTHT